MYERIVSYSAPGKMILFGEHSVVYGHPALAVAINNRVRSTIRNSLDKTSTLYVPNIFPDKVFPLIDKKSPHSSLKALFFLINYFKDRSEINLPLKIKIRSRLPSSAGLGSSAAVSVSLAKSLSVFYNLDLTLSEINKIAFRAEKIQHGNPSGIDNTIATYGGGIYYKEGDIKRISFNSNSFFWVIANTHIKRNTKDLVLRVKKNYVKNKSEVIKHFNSITELVNKALTFIDKGEIENLGYLMTQNQSILEKLNVSHAEINKLISVFQSHDSLGSKLTGAGGGGCVISLFDSLGKADKAIKDITKRGYSVFLTKIAKTGVKKIE